LATHFKTMLIRSGDSGYSCLIPDFRGKWLQFFPIKYNIKVFHR
jgi:hypothetical protein